MVNFLAVLCDGSREKGVLEQDSVYVAFPNLEIEKPTFVFLEVVAPSECQDTPGLKKVIIDTFKRKSLKSVIGKIVFFFRQTVLQ